MEWIVCKSYEELSKKGTAVFAAQIKAKPDSVLGFATGSSPEGVYAGLVELNRKGELDFSRVRTFNLDEYLPIPRSDSHSYYAFMFEHLFGLVNVKKENVHIPDGQVAGETAQQVCRDYDRMIEEAGGIDLQILGIGQNGHIGFNEPDDTLVAATHVTDLTENTLQANSRFFADPSVMPRQAITMGLTPIMKAKQIVVVVNGRNKHDAVMQLQSGKIDPHCPVTMLHMHPNVTILCDQEAYLG